MATETPNRPRDNPTQAVLNTLKMCNMFRCDIIKKIVEVINPNINWFCSDEYGEEAAYGRSSGVLSGEYVF